MVHAQTLDAEDPLNNLLPNVPLASAIGAAWGSSQNGGSRQAGQADANAAGSLAGMIGSIGNMQAPSPDMSQYSNHTPTPRWGTSAAYLQGSHVIVFTGGQTDTHGSITNETLLLDMSGLTNLQNTRAASRVVPWLDVNQSSHSQAAPRTAYAASVVSTSVCGATDGHVVDTFWLAGGKTEHCADQPYLWTFAVERNGNRTIGKWVAQETNGTDPKRRSHAQALLTSTTLEGQDAVAMLVLGGQDRDVVCHPTQETQDSYATSLDEYAMGSVLDSQCRSPNRAGTSTVQTYDYKKEIDSAPVTEYALARMPVLENQQTHQFETPYLLLGGRDKQHKLVDFERPWAYDSSSGRWTQWVTAGDIPTPRVGHSAVVSNDGRVFVYGGYKRHGDDRTVSKQPTDETYMLDASTTPARWTRVQYREPPEDGPAPSARAYHSAVMVDDVMVVAFGQQYKRTAYGLARRGGTNVNASEPLVMYMETRNTIMGFRWTDSLSAIVSGRVAQNVMGGQTRVASATFAAPTPAGQRADRPTQAPLPEMTRVPTPEESVVSQVSVLSKSMKEASRSAQASMSQASQASVASASASRSSASAASAAAAASADAADANKAGDANGNADGGESGNNNGHAMAPASEFDPMLPQSTMASSTGIAAMPSTTTQPSDKAGENGDNADGSSSSSRTGAIAGGVIGAAALCVGAVVGGLYAYKKRRESQQIAELRANGVLYGGSGRKDDVESAPPVSSLWLQRPLKDVVDNDFGRRSNMSAYSMQGQAGTPLSTSPAGGRSMGSTEEGRHMVRGPRSVYPDGMEAYSAAAAYQAASAGPNPFEAAPVSYDGAPSHEHYYYEGMPTSASSHDHMVDPFAGGVLRSSGTDMTTNASDYAPSMYSHMADGNASSVHMDEYDVVPAHEEDMHMRNSASTQQLYPYMPSERSQLRVMNN